MRKGLAATHKILEDFYEETFILFALHSSLQDHALVFALNEHLGAKFKRTKEDLDLNKEVSFPVFEWKDLVNDRYWTLITNQSVVEENLAVVDLFSNEPSTTVRYLIPEHKEVDYFLKIEQDEEEVPHLLRTIIDIPKVVTAYELESTQLKSRQNLIF